MRVSFIIVEEDSNFAESEDVTSEQKQRLLYTSERLNRSGIELDNTYRIAVETEEIGSQILTDLNRQRETMHNSFNRVSIMFNFFFLIKSIYRFTHGWLIAINTYCSLEMRTQTLAEAPEWLTP